MLSRRRRAAGAAARACRRVALSRPSIAARSASSNTSARTLLADLPERRLQVLRQGDRDGLQLGVHRFRQRGQVVAAGGVDAGGELVLQGGDPGAQQPDHLDPGALGLAGQQQRPVPRLGAFAGGQRGAFGADPGHLGGVGLAGLDAGGGGGVEAGQFAAGGAQHVRQLQLVAAAGQVDQGVLQLGDLRRVDQGGGLAGRHGQRQFGEPGGHREPGRVGEPGCVRAQQGPVVVGDAPPPRVRVHLGQREHHRVDAFAGGDQERQLRLRQRRGGVGDEQQRGGPFDGVQRDRGVRRVEPADAGGVEQADVLQQRRGWVTSMRRGPAFPGRPGRQVPRSTSTGSPAPGTRSPRGGPGREVQVRVGGHGRVDRGQAGHPEQRVDQ